MYLLDTNVVSELRKPDCDAAVRAWAATVDARLLFVSALTILEIKIGVLHVERRDSAQAAVLSAWLDDHVLTAFAGRVLPVDLDVVMHCAGLQVPDPKPDRDALIAAATLARGFTVVTRNVVEFSVTGVTIINPWEYTP